MYFKKFGIDSIKFDSIHIKYVKIYEKFLYNLRTSQLALAFTRKISFIWRIFITEIYIKCQTCSPGLYVRNAPGTQMYSV